MDECILQFVPRERLQEQEKTTDAPERVNDIVGCSDDY
jgi:hypothetical protein